MQTLLNHINFRLEEFTPPLDTKPDVVWDENSKCQRIDSQQFPVPRLLYFLLTRIFKLPTRSLGEKMHWNVAFAYKNNNYAITHEKFGLRLYMENKTEVKPKEVLGKLKKSLEKVEKDYLSSFAKEQISKGNITINNHFIKLDNQYKYFRDKATFEYAPKEINNSVDNENISPLELVNSLAARINEKWSSIRAGQYNTLAMIDAYYSRLEHLLVLALPFSKYDREKDNLSNFVGSLWSEKLRRILNFADKEVQHHYNALVKIKEKFRNTFAHGGFEKNGQSFYFHIDGIGAIPASMSGITESVHFDLFPIEKTGFEEICAIFDEFDHYLSNTAFPEAWKYAESGLDLALDERNLGQLLDVIDDPQHYEEWIERMLYWNDQYDNADY